jgi:ketosteroid isomerase-like protein
MQMSRSKLLRTGATGAAFGAAALALPALARADGPESVQVAEIYQLQAAFHRAKSHQDIDLMMSLWANDGTVTFGSAVFDGIEAIQAFFLSSGSWKHQRASLVPSFKDEIQVRGDTAFLYFECHDVALTDESPTAPAGTLVTHLFNAGSVRNVGGNWLYWRMIFGSAAPLSVDHIYYP